MLYKSLNLIDLFLSRSVFYSFVLALLFFSLASSGLARSRHRRIPSDRQWQQLDAPKAAIPFRHMYRQAAHKLGSWKIRFAGRDVTGKTLLKWSQVPVDEDFTRALRERSRLPLDPVDFLYFLDDVLQTGRQGMRGKTVWITRGRARSAGILLHPDDIFRDHKPRVYGEAKDHINVDRPRRQESLKPAQDGDVLGPRWSARFKNLRGVKVKLQALRDKRPCSDFADRIQSLLQQLRKQGCDVTLETTLRDQRRGYLMWGAFVLSRQKTGPAVRRKLRMLKKAAQDWNLDVHIRWKHPKGWRATVDAGRRMADAYEVVYASRAGAERSRHYDAEAVDFTAVALPRTLHLRAPDGAKHSFDLSDPAQSRDISLTPEVIDWVEKHFFMQKLHFDYVHWNDSKLADVCLNTQGRHQVMRTCSDLVCEDGECSKIAACKPASADAGS